MKKGEEIVVYTDGACSGNPGPGGWAAILRWGKHEQELCGFEPQTTNNRMELRAAVEALKSIRKKDIPIRIVTDSQYVQHAFTQNWIQGWIRKGWITSAKTPVKNRDLWEELLRLTGQLQVKWDWTKGHSDDCVNNRCDALARGQVEKHMKWL